MKMGLVFGPKEIDGLLLPAAFVSRLIQICFCRLLVSPGLYKTASVGCLCLQAYTKLLLPAACVSRLI